jgi:predicted dithiol-disulfide oxidoreductase (DUF899 family)
MPDHKTATREEWEAALAEQIAREKELTRKGDELSEQRRALPWLKIETEYTFESAEGSKTLAELFGGRSQLLIYHFMFGQDWNAGCPACTAITDTLSPQVPHVKARDTTLVLASSAPLEKLLDYKRRMGWDEIDWVSTGESDFRHEIGWQRTREELKPFLDGDIPDTVQRHAEMCGTDVGSYVSEGPGLTAYILSDGDVYQTYATTSRGLEIGMAFYPLLDRTPYGRQEGGPGAWWLRRHDEYAAA